jgi:F0F1-type ATP synthase alpha subunit
MILFLISNELIRYISLDSIVEFKYKFLSYISTDKVYKNISADKELTPNEISSLRTVCLNFIKKYNANIKLDEDLQAKFEKEFKDKKGDKK